MPFDVWVQELADRSRFAAQRRFVAAASQLDVALCHTAIFASLCGTDYRFDDS